MARPREPVDLIAAKGRKHLTIAEYVERKNAEITAPADKVKPPDFLLKKEKEKFDEIFFCLGFVLCLGNQNHKYSGFRLDF